jgi:hypothetical protein
MESRIYHPEISGKPVLGFDTALDAQSFAQAKMASYMTQKGSVVFPNSKADGKADGRVETWQPEGVAELEREPGGPQTMVIWGPSFPGERLAGIIADPGRRDEALDALRYWLRARPLVEGAVSPAGVFIVTDSAIREDPAGKRFPVGTLLFPPERLVKRCLEAEGIDPAGERLHPDLSGGEGIAYSAGLMMYEIFCGVLPFKGEDPLVVRQDIREGVFLPPGLAAPGLDEDLARLISLSLAPVKQKSGAPPRPDPETIAEALGSPGSRSPDSWITPPGGEALAKIRLEGEQFSKRKNLTVKTRRFLIRNTALVSGLLITALVLFLGVRSFIKTQEERPTTLGMAPLEVAEAYYEALGKLDHETMSACVTGKAGKGDIEMAINLFVISRVRGAYEAGGLDNVVSAGDWLAAGSPETDKTVFGVTDLRISTLGERDGEAQMEASYTLWMPDNLSAGMSITDRLRLGFTKDRWRIVSIERESPESNSEGTS